MQNTFRIQKIGQSLLIDLGKEYRDGEWAETFGKIKKLVSATDTKEIVINLRFCKWVDPTPLLSFSLLFRKNANKENLSCSLQKTPS